MAFVVVATWVAEAGEEDAVAAAIERLVGPSRAEPGNLLYLVHRDPRDPRLFFFYEQYRDEASYQAHGVSEHFQRDGFGDAVPRLASRQRTFYETWDL